MVTPTEAESDRVPRPSNEATPSSVLTSQSCLYGDSRSGGAVAHLQLGEDAAQVPIHGPLTDEQTVGELVISGTFGEDREHLAFSSAEPRNQKRASVVRAPAESCRVYRRRNRVVVRGGAGFRQDVTQEPLVDAAWAEVESTYLEGNTQRYRRPDPAEAERPHDRPDRRP